MVYRRRRILLAEIDRQSKFALMAYDDAAAALEKRDAERFWYSLQALVAAAAHLRRLLWPSPNASLAWAVELRTTLEVPDDSPLNQAPLAAATDLVAILESWNAERPGRVAAESNFSAGGLAKPSQGESVRSFDPETGAFTIFGSLINLPPLLNAIVELGRKTELEAQHLREVV